MSLTLTESAAEHIKAFGGKDRIRLSAKTDGCAGLTYHLSIINRVVEGDTVFESREVEIIVDAKSLPFLDGTEIDYISEGVNKIFAYNNPHAINNCGCGMSFTTGE